MAGGIAGRSSQNDALPGWWRCGGRNAGADEGAANLRLGVAGRHRGEQ
jgi:hypothetical protein